MPPIGEVGEHNSNFCWAYGRYIQRILMRILFSNKHHWGAPCINPHIWNFDSWPVSRWKRPFARGTYRSIHRPKNCVSRPQKHICVVGAIEMRLGTHQCGNYLLSGSMKWTIPQQYLCGMFARSNGWLHSYLLVIKHGNRKLSFFDEFPINTSIIALIGDFLLPRLITGW